MIEQFVANLIKTNELPVPPNRPCLRYPLSGVLVRVPPPVFPPANRNRPSKIRGNIQKLSCRAEATDPTKRLSGLPSNP